MSSSSSSSSSSSIVSQKRLRTERSGRGSAGVKLTAETPLMSDPRFFTSSSSSSSSSQSNADPSYQIALQDIVAMCRDLARAFEQNTKLRTASREDSQLVADSDASLIAALQHMQGLAASPEFYGLINQNVSLAIVSELICHPHISVANSTIRFLG